MPDKTSRYNFEANTAGFLAGIKSATKGLDVLAAKVTSVMQRINTAAVGTSPAFTGIKNSSKKLQDQFSTMGTQMASVMNQMTLNTRLLNTVIDTMASSAVRSMMAMNQAAAQVGEKVAATIPPFKAMGTEGTQATSDITDGAEEVIPALGAITPAANTAISAFTAIGTIGLKVFNGIKDTIKTIIDYISTSLPRVLKLFGLAIGGDILGQGIASAKDYIEVLNLFNVAMGTASNKANTFMNNMSTKLGLDPSALMNTQGRFVLLAKSMGIASEQAYTMSEGMTQLTIDIASLWNMPIEAVESKLASGFVGYSRAVRDLGKDISLIAIQEEARMEGLNVNVRTLSQASKMQLRYNALMRQSAAEMGDFARTSMQPANQMRILQEQFAITSRYIGAIFLPAIAKIIPYLIAIIQLAGMVAEAIAVAFGWGDMVAQAKANAEKAGSEVKMYGDDVDGLGDSADAAGKKLDAMTSQGFDEMNRLDKATNSAADGLGGFGGGANIAIATPSYDMGLNDVLLQATEIKNQILSWWDGFKTNPTFLAFLDIVKQAWEDIKIAAEWAWIAIQNVFTFVVNNWNWIGPVLLGVAAFLALASAVVAVVAVIAIIGALGAGVGIVIAAIVAAVVAIVALVIANWGAISTFFTNLWEGIKGIAVSVWNFICNFFVVKNQFLSDILTGLWTGIKNIVVGAWEFIRDFFIVTIPEIFNNIVTWFNELPYKIGYALGQIIGTLAKWVVNTIDWIVINVPKIILAIIEFFWNLPMDVALWLAKVLDNIITWVFKAYGTFRKWASDTVWGIIDYISQLPQKIFDWLITTLINIVLWTNQAYKTLTNWAFDTVQGIIDWFLSLPKKLYDIGISIIQGIWNGMNSMITWIKTKVGAFLEGFVQGIKDVLGIKSPSKVFASMGENMVAGMVVGIDSSASLLQKSFNALPTPNMNFEAGLVTSYAGAYGSMPRSTSVGAVPSQPAISEENLYRAVSRALQDMPPTSLNIDGEQMATTMNSVNSGANRRYGKW